MTKYRNHNKKENREAAVNPRNLALTILEKIHKGDCYSNLAIRQALDDNPAMDSRDKALVKRIVEGCLERQIELDYIINHFSKTPVNKCKPLIRYILRMAAYQIVYMDNIPDSAACNEAVKLTTKRGFVNLKNFVNGVLRSVSRAKTDIDGQRMASDCQAKNSDKKSTGMDRNTKSYLGEMPEYIRGTTIAYPPYKDKKRYLSVKYSTPEWLVDMWIRELGEEQTEKILEAFLKERPVCIRIKCVDGKKADLSDETGLILDQVDINKDSFFDHSKETAEIKSDKKISDKEISDKEKPDKEKSDIERLNNICYQLKAGSEPAEIKEFKEGLITVQDPSSVLAVLMSGIQPGNVVIDVCAAPGGKSIFAGELAGRDGRVLAFDVSDKKIPIMNQNKERMQADNVSFAVGDATVFNPALENKADVLLCDVPCSGLGVIGKKRDIKYKADESRIEGLVPIQRDILNNVCRYVKPGGRLCYSTCTISRRENADQIELFLKAHKEFELQEMQQLLPNSGCNDGFFIAIMTRTKL